MVLVREKIGKHDAELRTARHKRDFATLEKGWLALGREVQKSIDLGVPALLGRTMRQWMAETFDESASHIYRQLQSYRALKSVPQAKLEQISESSAHQLTRLPEKIRKDPELIEKAVKQTSTEFRNTVHGIREKKLGFKPEAWRTFAVRGPVTWYEQMEAAQNKVAEILKLDLTNNEKRATNLIAVWEAISVLVNTTPKERLLVEIEGEDCNS